MNNFEPKIEVKQLFDRDSCTYTYLLIDSSSQQAAIIDPVLELIDRDLSIISELGLELLYTIETHAHADHITSSGKIRQITGAKLAYSANSEVKAIDFSLQDGDELEIGSHVLRAIETPGHTSGCMSYLCDGYLFCGDALLIRGCGRTDFQQGDAAMLFDSITNKFFTLPDNTVVYPGHDYNGRTSSSIAEEKRWNPRLGNNRDRQSFVDLMNNLNLDLPKKIHEAVPANMNVGINFEPDRFLMKDFNMNDLYRVWEFRQPSQLIVDNRTEKEFAQGHVPGSLNIPLGTENEQIDTIKQYEEVYIYCRSGRRAQTAVTNLSLQGLGNLVCIGHSGMPDWIEAGLPVEP